MSRQTIWTKEGEITVLVSFVYVKFVYGKIVYDKKYKKCVMAL